MALDPPKEYLDYLDKEMTIMGILSTFCVAAASLVIDRVCGADKGSFFKTLAEKDSLEVFVGSAFLIAAGLCFYLQRSLLAHFYGSICMSIAVPDLDEYKTVDWLKDVYSWATWLRYRVAFSFLMGASVIFGHAIYLALFFQKYALWWLVWACFALIILDAVIRDCIISAYRFESRPYYTFWNKLRRMSRKRTSLSS